MTDDAVSFRWKDYRHGSQVRTLTLDAAEFLRRFLLHVLPKGFVRIRYFGVLAPRCRTHALAQCRQALIVEPAPAPADGPVASRPSIVMPPASAKLMFLAGGLPRFLLDKPTSLPFRCD